jgi:flavodoxin
MSKILISYFSASGTTKRVAEKVATAVNGDLFEIEPKEKYTDADLNWMDKNSRSSIEMNQNVQPDILNKVSNLNDYDTVVLGFPIWWYKEPTIIDRFLDENDMNGKKIYVFVTSGSSSIDSTYKSLLNNYPNLNFVGGKRFTGSESEEDFKSWINN